MSASDIWQVLSVVATPLVELRKVLKKYQTDKKIKREFSDALEAEAIEFGEVTHDLTLAGEVAVSLITEIKDQPTPAQLSDFVDVVTQIPNHLARLLISYIHVAKACKEISNQKGFMEALRTSNNYMHDFVEIMSNAYIAKDTVRFDGNFFRFYRIYKNDISKHTKGTKLGPKQTELLTNNVDVLIQALTLELKKTHTKRPLIKKWQSSFKKLLDTSKDVKIEDVDYEVLKDTVPEELLKLFPVLDNSI